MINVQNMPKIELHVHLDGSVRLQTASELSGVPLSGCEQKMMVQNDCSDLNEYLRKFDFPLSLLQTKENLKRVSKELAIDLRKENVVYAEIRFAPGLHINNELNYDEIIESIMMGLNEVPSLKYNLILCMMRNHNLDINKKVIKTAKKYLNKGVCAVDLAGAEALYPTKNFKVLFDYAKQMKIPFTIHAGEADGIDSIKSALEFGTKRLGHGVRIIESDDLMNVAKDQKIYFEICPTSNIQTGLYKNLEIHPIKKLFDEGLLITINTDNRTVSNITLTDEYENLMDTFQFSISEIIKMNVNAIDASFLSDEEKVELKNKFINL